MALSTVRVSVLGVLLSATSAVAAELVVGSGDLTAGSAVLLARSDVPGVVTFEVSTTPDFSSIVGTGTAVVPAGLTPSKLDVVGLSPAQRYFFRATDAAGLSASGTFRTPAPLGVRQPLRVATMTDWQQSPPFPTVRNVADRRPDLILKLGDTIYADTETRGLPGVRQARTLEQFRAKHREIISRSGLSATPDNFMAAAYASAAMFNTIDDHEVVDNFAGGAAPGLSPDAPLVHPTEPPLFTDPVPFVNQTRAYRDAMQAYVEYHPMRPTVWSGTGDARVDGVPRLYRHQTFGSTASITMLDSRSFRDAQVAPVGNPTDPAAVSAFLARTFTPGRTLLGRPQLEALKADLLQNQRDGVVWKLVVIPEPIQNFGVVNAEDRFEGYAAERTELLSFIHTHNIENVVFIAGDFHGTIVNNLAYQVPTAGGLVSVPVNAFEVVTGPVGFFNGRFGPAVANLAAAAGLITPAQLAFYNTLPEAGKDAFIRGLVDAQVTALGYSPIGLEDSGLNATLLQGSYFAAHGFSWTEFDIDARDQLTVTTWSIDAFSDAQALADPQRVLSLQPRVVSQFVVAPIPEPASLAWLAPAVVLLARRR
ncbi:MAG: alkaline phosphatase D family protein [Tepidisphaerales bacterium]